MCILLKLKLHFAQENVEEVVSAVGPGGVGALPDESSVRDLPESLVSSELGRVQRFHHHPTGRQNHRMGGSFPLVR